MFDIPIANNKATADFIITSKFMNSEYRHRLIDFERSVEERAEQLEEEVQKDELREDD